MVGPWRMFCEEPKLPEGFVAGAVRRNWALLINPWYRKGKHGSAGKHVLTPTLALTTIAAATPAHWEVSLWDENLLQIGMPGTHENGDVGEIPQIVGITVHLTFARRAYELARWYRQRGSIVILGGLHMASCPDEAAPHADAIAIGNGVEIWPRFLADVESGKFCTRNHAAYVQRSAAIYRAPYTNDFSSEPSPQRNLLHRSSYLTTSSLIATRGCHNRCDFCYLSTNDVRMPYRMKEPEQIAGEFAADEQPYGVFLDNNLGSKREYLRELCRCLRPLNKIWSAAVSIDVTDDHKLIQDMALAGCTGVFVGFESVTDDNLRLAGKRTPLVEDYARRVRLFHEWGIQVNGSFVLGFDHDGPDVFQNTVGWIEQNRLECSTFHILTPYPGTPLFRKMQTEGRLLHQNWDMYDTAHVVFQPKNMSVAELEAGYVWCYERLFSHASIWQRRPERGGLSALAAYMAGAYLYKKCNWIWPWLIRYRCVGYAWRPLIELSRWRHVRWRKNAGGNIAGQSSAQTNIRGALIEAGV